MVIGANPLTGTPGISGSGTVGWFATAHRLPSGIDFGDLFGQSVAFVGDLDGEAGQEYLVGAPQYASESGSTTTKGPGYVRLFRTGSHVPIVTISGDQGPSDNPRREGEAFGFSVAGGVSLNPNDDTVPDFVVGAPLFNVHVAADCPDLDKAGRVRAYSGASAVAGGPVVPLLVDPQGVNGTIMVGTCGADQFGYSVAVMPNLDVDGGPEIIAGAWQGATGSVFVCNQIPPHQNPRTTAGGYALLYTSGGLSGTPGLLATFYGELGRDHLGRAVAVGELFGTSAHPEIVLSGLAWNPYGYEAGVDPTEFGRGYAWDGDSVLVPPP